MKRKRSFESRDVRSRRRTLPGKRTSQKRKGRRVRQLRTRRTRKSRRPKMSRRKLKRNTMMKESGTTRKK